MAKTKPSPSIPQSTAASPPAPAVRRPQFTLAGLMIVMLVLAVTAAPLYYLARAGEGEPGAWLAGILMLLASPMLLIVILSAALAIMNHWKRK